jgi:hypothetical protein
MPKEKISEQVVVDKQVEQIVDNIPTESQSKKTNYDVFISHKRKDEHNQSESEQVARSVYETLTHKYNLQCFLDRENLSDVSFIIISTFLFFSLINIFFIYFSWVN